MAGETVTDLPLSLVLADMPKKVFESTTAISRTKPLKCGALTIRQAVASVLGLPSVCSKRFLVHKVDRSVTGLVAQQQTVRGRAEHCRGARRAPGTS